MFVGLLRPDCAWRVRPAPAELRPKGLIIDSCCACWLCGGCVVTVWWLCGDCVVAKRDGPPSLSRQLHSKGVIVLTESRVADSNKLNIDVYITAKLAQKMSPTARAIAWCVTGEELITDSLEFNVAGAFANKVGPPPWFNLI